MPVTRSVSLVAAGGAISVVPTASGARTHRGADELAPVGSALPSEVEVHPRDVLRRSSRAMTLDDLWVLAQAVRAEIAAGHDGPLRPLLDGCARRSRPSSGVLDDQLDWTVHPG